MIQYSRQNPIDLNSTRWTFSPSLNRFYNWLNQPIQGLTPLPAQKYKLQLFAMDNDATSINTSISVINAQTSQELPGVAYGYEVPSTLSGTLFEYIVDCSLIPDNTVYYIQVIVEYVDVRSETLQSSCFINQIDSDDKLIKIEFANTISNRPVNGILFDPDAPFFFYLYAKKYDTEIEVNEDEKENDFSGNATLVDKTHSETDIFELVDIPKKRFMSLVAISENDEIVVQSEMLASPLVVLGCIC